METAAADSDSLFTIISIILAVGAAGLPLVALVARRNTPLDWQFIRFVVVSVAIPITAILAMGGALTEAAAAIVAGVVGYAFGHAPTNLQRTAGNPD